LIIGVIGVLYVKLLGNAGTEKAYSSLRSDRSAALPPSASSVLISQAVPPDDMTSTAKFSKVSWHPARFGTK